VFVQSYHIVYDGAAELGDRLNITTFISDMRRSSGTRHFLITREKDGAPVCRARLRFAFVDLETGRPAPLPDRVRADFDGHIVE
jgi:acyl-CoA thioesterase FadM